MNKSFLFIMGLLPLLAACGYKGDLYLPKENDDARFGVIQTGIDFRKPNKKSSEASAPAAQTPSLTYPSMEQQ